MDPFVVGLGTVTDKSQKRQKSQQDDKVAEQRSAQLPGNADDQLYFRLISLQSVQFQSMFKLYHCKPENILTTNSINSLVIIQIYLITYGQIYSHEYIVLQIITMCGYAQLEARCDEMDFKLISIMHENN